MQAWGHQSSVVYSEVAVRGRAVEYTFQVSNGDLYEALGLGQDRPVQKHEVEAGRERLGRYLAERVVVQNHGAPCPGSVGALSFLPRADGFFVSQQVRYECQRSIEELALTYNLFFDIDPRHQGLAHVDAFGGQSEHVFRAANRELRLSHPLTAWDHAMDYLALGVEHIFTGYDHLAFLFALLIIAGALSAPAGQAEGRAAAVRRGAGYVVRVVTAFTVAHSVTLILAALEVVRLPGALVEAVIAASIGYVALENLLRPRPAHRFLLTFGFGLVHGFGFASVLREIGLPGKGLLLSLLSFNVGVEVGQLVVVALVLPLLHALAWQRPERGIGAVEAALLLALAGASYWFFSGYGLPKVQLGLVVFAAPALLVALVPRYGYERCVRKGGSAVIFVLAVFWLVERMSGRTFFGGALG
jgi:hypothetical protein